MITVGQYKSNLFKLDGDIFDIIIYLDDKLLSSDDEISPDCTVVLVLNRIPNKLTEQRYKIVDLPHDLSDTEEESDEPYNTELIDYFLPDYF